ncbi:hypothetical protein D3X11_06330 [Streptococcus sp. X16XC17]|uniref:LURP-one-related/scramblase family protein n=1 Tax=unclassified Streptococcus TaxID=2608887 RepID=UPI00066FF61A|nr:MULTISPECIES: LURP-one-related family protein [unclassified Streptococcus]TCD45823.1 hypothetical protein D3X11_06330 [Streptococcus sp. X16XC17]
MKEYRIKQKFLSLNGTFDIADELGLPVYHVEGSFLKWFKEFTVTDSLGKEVSSIKHRFSFLLPEFEVTMASGETFTLLKEFTFFKDKYSINNLGLEINGDWWDMNFTLSKNGRTIAQIHQEWLRLASTYQGQVLEDDYADLVVTLVIAIDYVKQMEAAANNG